MPLVTTTDRRCGVGRREESSDILSTIPISSRSQPTLLLLLLFSSLLCLVSLCLQLQLHLFPLFHPIHGFTSRDFSGIVVVAVVGEFDIIMISAVVAVAIVLIGFCDYRILGLTAFCDCYAKLRVHCDSQRA